jgi:hypothetical protein
VARATSCSSSSSSSSSSSRPSSRSIIGCHRSSAANEQRCRAPTVYHKASTSCCSLATKHCSRQRQAVARAQPLSSGTMQTSSRGSDTPLTEAPVLSPFCPQPQPRLCMYYLPTGGGRGGIYGAGGTGGAAIVNAAYQSRSARAGGRGGSQGWDASLGDHAGGGGGTGGYGGEYMQQK